MNLRTVIEHLRAHCPTFSNRISGAAQFKHLDETVNFAVPAAWVIPLDDNPGENLANNATWQLLTESFAVVVALSNQTDEPGQAASDQAVDDIRAELWAALLGWQPDGLAEASIYRGTIYQGGALLDIDRARLWWQFEFGAERQITEEDGYKPTELAALPHLDVVYIDEDQVDPAADPNLQYPGPDGRIEHVTRVPKSGNLPT